MKSLAGVVNCSFYVDFQGQGDSSSYIRQQNLFNFNEATEESKPR